MRPVWPCFLLAAACSTEVRDDGGAFGSQTGAASGGASGETGGADPGGDGDTSVPTTDGGTDMPADDGAGDTDAVKFDLPSGTDLASAGDGGGEGCDKVDFLFVVDNSGSMSDEQDNLAASFPGFIAAIVENVVSEYRIMVIDTDAGGGGGCIMSTIGPPDCAAWCASQCLAGCDCSCNGVSCPGPSDPCDETLGAGKLMDPQLQSCGVTSGHRWLDEAQPGLAPTFACLATVGIGGDGNERPMEAAIEAVTTQVAAGECNDGFVRPDALLIVTVISDEEDAGKSAGDPASWHADLALAKGGDGGAIVALGLVGDSGVPGGLCEPYVDGGDGAEDAPRLRQWAESFEHGQWASVCAADYAEFFLDAVGIIDTACDEFEPPG